MALDGRRRGHLRGNEMRACPAALAALEVPVGGARDALARTGDVRVHAQTHGATCAAPVEAGAPEHLIQALTLGLELHLGRPRDDHGVDVAGDLAPAYDRGGGT